MDSPEGVTTYGYDDLDRLVEACFDEDCPLPSSPAVRWTYDDVGNRTAEERPEGTTTYAYDAADRLLTLTDPPPYGWDGAGKRISAATGSGTTEYLWDVTSPLPELVLEREGGYPPLPVSLDTPEEKGRWAAIGTRGSEESRRAAQAGERVIVETSGSNWQPLSYDGSCRDLGQNVAFPQVESVMRRAGSSGDRAAAF